MQATIASCLWPYEVTAQQQEQVSIERQLLQARGIPLTAEGIRKTLAEINPTRQSKELVVQLIRELGAEEFAVREAAMQKILLLRNPPIELLEQAKAGDDPEIRARAARLLEQLGPSEPIYESLLFSCLLVTRDQAELGMAKDLLQLAPRCVEPAFCRAAWQAMEKTVRAADVSELRKALKDENESIRAMAVVGLLALGGQVREAQSALDDVNFSQEPMLVQFIWFKHQLEQGDPQHLPELAAFCDAEDPALSLLAIHALHRAFDAQKVSRDQLLAQFKEKEQPKEKDQQTKQADGQSDLDDLVLPARKALLARVEGQGMPAPVPGWTDFFFGKLAHGESEGQPTAFVKGLPPSLMKVVQREKRAANTINSVASRHGTAPWLYPSEGKNEAPHVLRENGNWYFPIHRTWAQHWGGGWTFLDENGQVIISGASGGPHIESVLEFVVVPVANP